MDDRYFREYNTNPKGKITQDCVIRSLALFLNRPYDIVLDDLINIYKTTGYHSADPVCFMFYLLQISSIKKQDVAFASKLKLVDLCEFLNTICTQQIILPDTQNHSEFSGITHKNCNKLLVLLENTHLTFLENSVIIDTWNCSCLRVISYFYYLSED